MNLYTNAIERKEIVIFVIALSNIICINCNRYYNNKEVWLCTNHWQQHTIEKHE